MKKNTQISLAKVLLSLSFIFILIAIGLNLEEKTVLNPISNTHIINKPEANNINITTTETPIKIPDQSETIPPSNNPSSSTQDPILPPNQANPFPEVTNLAEINNTIRKEIENKYGIKVSYGVETNGYTVADLTTFYLTDDNRINNLLKELDYNLSLYPNGFFNETKKGGYTLTIYLLKSYSQENVTGITDSTTKNILISLATDYSYIESLNHEIYHYIEKYMYQKGVNYTTWNNLNPKNFNYGKENELLSYANTKNVDAFFVNNYAQTDQYEDRASTFEYMMAKDEALCLETGTTIWKKAKYISEQIDAIFDTVNANTIEYWERFVYN